MHRRRFAVTDRAFRACGVVALMANEYVPAAEAFVVAQLRQAPK